MSSIATQFDQVTVITKANLYFEGKVVSHTVVFQDGSKKTLGLIFPGSYHFGTDKSERMEIVAGSAKVKLDSSTDEQAYGANSFFEVPSKSGFTIVVEKDACEYICSYLD
jgi:purine/pyrimidine-nucleoside phosphorylase